jgi:hypothetical protein
MDQKSSDQKGSPADHQHQQNSGEFQPGRRRSQAAEEFFQPGDKFPHQADGMGEPLGITQDKVEKIG